jgi:hypothetical protein
MKKVEPPKISLSAGFTFPPPATRVSGLSEVRNFGLIQQGNQN